MIFQALGSNYSFIDTWRILLARGRARDSQRLSDLLADRYGGKAVLYAKGRYALSAAVWLTTHDQRNAVAVNALTCSVVVDAIHEAGATPRYADVTATRCHFDTKSLQRTLTAHRDIGAVIVQNTFGEMIDIRPIEKIARAHKLVLIEDLAHCLGQTYPDGREAGTVGDLVMLSFGRDKVIDVVNGGALIVRNEHLLERLELPTRPTRRLEQLRDRIYPGITAQARATYRLGLGKLILALGFRLRILVRSAEGGIHRDQCLPHWQARLACREFARLEKNLDHRRSRMAIYHEELGKQLLSPHGTLRAAVHAASPRRYWQQLRAHHAELYDTWYDTPIGPARKYRQLEYPTSECPRAVQRAKHMINLPTHRAISDDKAKQLAHIIQKGTT